MKKMLLFVMLFLSTSTANAEVVEVWHGWTNLTPCSKVEWNNNGLFGTPAPTARSAPQELHAWIKADVSTSSSDIMNRLKDILTKCGAVGAAAAGSTALVTGGAGAWDAFNVAFQGCISQTDVSSLIISWNLSTESKCNW